MNTRSVTEERILRAAVHLFAEQGFSGTSTRDIARLADVNETTLFRHYPRKQQLFWAALQWRIGQVRLRKELQAGLEHDAEPAVVVPLIVEFLVQVTMYEGELVRLFSFGLLELRPAAEPMYRRHLAPPLQALTEYLSRCAAGGKLPNLDPAIFTTAFVSSILAHQMVTPLFNGASLPYANSEEAVVAYTQFWTHVLTSGRSLEMVFPATGGRFRVNRAISG